MMTDMSTLASDLFEKALALSPDDRARLLQRLLESLDGSPDDGAEAAWASEISRRLERIDKGEAKAMPMDESLARLNSAARGS
jgi:putative addiction module component (TIGR02574 family)